MTTYLPIVGMNFRPPALTLVKALSVGTPLYLRAEPNNIHDSNARAVILKTSDIDDPTFTALDDGRLKTPMTIRDLAALDEIQLGYIPAIAASDPRIVALPQTDIPGEFTISSSGVPQIKFDAPSCTSFP